MNDQGHIIAGGTSQNSVRAYAIESSTRLVPFEVVSLTGETAETASTLIFRTDSWTRNRQLAWGYQVAGEREPKARFFVQDLVLGD